jgi:drug/metabolite transporter (DMT)-like permease
MLEPRLPVGVGAAMLAALLFGASTPAVKLLSTDLGANVGAGLLYLGSGLGVLLLLAVKHLRGAAIVSVPANARARFFGAIVAGGVVAPVLLVLGLQATAASTASLLLNLEGVATAAIAWVVFRENVDRRIALGMAAIVVGGAVVTVDVSSGFTFNAGAALIVGACICWGIDNNLTQAASSADPLLVAGIKGAAAGSVNVVVALLLAQPWPSLSTAALLMLVGFVGYGLSLACFVVALRHLGTSRTGAWFGTAPFVGAVTSLIAFHEPLTWPFAAAGTLMVVGMGLHLQERHEHEHTHEPLEHDHEHEHDEHHQHAHADGAVIGGKHSHVHHHDPLTHTHPHQPDLHHRHSH